MLILQVETLYSYADKPSEYGMFHISNIKKVNQHNTFRRLSGCIAIAAGALMFASCNEKSEVTGDEYVSPSNVAVTAFSLGSDSKVMEDLDSVFFSIDLDNGVIFNADSLPVGTKINKLVPKITYSQYVTEAKIKMEGGTTRTGEVDYTSSSTDSIDFTGKVTLTLSTSYGDYSKDYKLKVNVHKEQADSLIWGDRAVSALPSRLSSPRTQKSIDYNGRAISLIEESDGTYTIASSTNLYESNWSKQAVTFPFVPDVRSLCATSSRLCILASDGALYESADGRSWTATGQRWASMLGAYLDTAIGLKVGTNGLEYSQYPLKELADTEADPEFPTNGFSNFVILANKWTSSPVGFFVGGVKSDGSLSNVTWAFDGRHWIKLAQGGIPAVAGASIIPYYSFRKTTSSWTQTEFPVWMVIGGRQSDGKLNRTVYISYDNGVNWGRGNEKLQLPKNIPTMTECDNVVMTTQRDANLSDYWKGDNSGKRKINVWTEGDIIYWDCPYIYLIGGVDPTGKLCNTVWRGVLARLSFTPII